MNQQPLVSIIIPVYNGANFMSQAIESALQQTYVNCEVIVVNDGSKDEGTTEKIALSYGSKIRYYYKENGGIASALNYGIEKMNGDYFSWLSHDDVYAKDKISFQINQTKLLGLADETVFMCGSGLINAKGNTILHPEKKLTGIISGRQMFDICCNDYAINGLTLLIPKGVIEKYGVFEDYRYCQDAECWFRYMLNGVSFFCDTTNKLVYYRIHPEQTTNTIPQQYYIDRASIDQILYKMVANGNDTELLSKLYKRGILTGDNDLLSLFTLEEKEIFEKEYNRLRYKGKMIRGAKYIYRRVFKKYKF